MGRRRGQSKKRATWEANPIELTIENLSHEGRGVGKHDGKTVFVEGALPGETVKAVYTQRRSNYDEAKLEQIIEASADRVTPPCPHADICGGCTLQHLEPSRAIAFKESVLKEQLQHFAGSLPVDGFMPPTTDQVVGYRRKARLAVKYVPKKGGVLVGFREKQSHFIANIDQCVVLDPRVGELIEPLKQMITGLDANASIPQIEVAMGDPDALGGPVDKAGVTEREAAWQGQQVALIFRHLAPISDGDQQTLEQFADQHGVELYLQSKGMDTVKRVYPKGTAKGTDLEMYPDERLGYALPDQQVQFKCHPTDFTQVNAGINKKMMTQALDLLALSPTDRVLDLFCGLGNFTLPMARQAAHVVGVEGSALMVERGYENAAFNQITNVSFYADDLIGETPTWNSEWADAQYDKLLLDPPRSGALEIVNRIERFAAPRIVYVSCNPATLARDAGILISKGYVMKQAGVMDMFPHTAHVESIALFEKP